MKSFYKENFWFIALFMTGWIILIFIRLIIGKGTLLLEMSNYRNEELNNIFLWITRLGEVFSFLLCIAVFSLIRYRYALAFIVNGITVLLLTGILKWIFKFERPFLYFKNLGEEMRYKVIEGVVPYEGLSSFPSGHTMAGFALMALASFYVRQEWLKVSLFFLACLIALSRIYLGHHFLEDILSGSMVGLLIAIIIYRLSMQWKGNYLDQNFKIRWLNGNPDRQIP